MAGRRLLATAILVLGCADPGGDGVVAPGDPHTGVQALDAAMWRLAASSARIDELANDPGGAARHQAEILSLLDQMDASLVRLQRQLADSEETGAAMVEQHGDRFRADIRAARADVAGDPPRYERAAAVREACLRCHGAPLQSDD